MANLSEMFKSEALQDEVDFNNLPEERSASGPPPPPGPYVFGLPKTLSAANFGPVETEKGQRAKVSFNNDAPLTILQATEAAKDFVNTPLKQTITNVPRKRGFGDDAPVASDWDYLNRALGVTARPKSNKEFAEQLLKDAAAGKSFAADIEWSWRCSTDRDAYFDDGQGGSAPMPDANSPGNNMKGCGAKYYQGQTEKAADVANNKSGYVTKQDGAWPLRIACSCGAIVRAFPSLARIRPAQ